MLQTTPITAKRTPDSRVVVVPDSHGPPVTTNGSLELLFDRDTATTMVEVLLPFSDPQRVEAHLGIAKTLHDLGDIDL